MVTRSVTIKPGIIAEASTWFAEFRAGGMTGGARARFDEWLRHSPEHIQAYLEVAAGWSELPTADPEGRIDVEALVALARASEDENVVLLSQGDGSHVETPRSAWMYALAACVALITILMGAGTWVWMYRAGTYSTGIGEQRTLSLADGSTVILNALTTVRVRFNRATREVDLIRGQAFFHDTDDPERPFIVRSDGATVRALGTQFDVYMTLDGILVTVLEGRVALAKSPHQPLPSIGTEEPRLLPVLVSAGEQAIITAQLVGKPKPADIRAATAWVEKRLVFDNTPLREVADQFNLYSSRSLVIADPALRSVGVSGVYSSADPESLIGFLQAQPGLLVIETPKEITVSRRGQK